MSQTKTHAGPATTQTPKPAAAISPSPILFPHPEPAKEHVVGEGGTAANTPVPPTVTFGPGGTEIPLDRRASTPKAYTGPDRRGSAVDPRAGVERRVVDVGSPTGLERRRGPGRRRTDDRRSAEEGEMTDEQFEFVLAIDTYKRLNNRPFPSWTEVLEVIKQLGYRKVATSSLSLQSVGGRAPAAPVTPPAPTSVADRRATPPVPAGTMEKPDPSSEYLPG